MATNANKRVVAFQLKVESLGDDIKSIKDIDKQVKELVKSRKELNVTTEQGAKEYEEITNQIAKLKGVQAQERQELRKQVKSFQLLGENVDVAKGSIRDLQQQQKELREQLSRNTRGTTIAAETYDKLENQFKENAITIQDFNRNLAASNQLVGEYDRGILNALKNFGGFDQLAVSLEGLNKKQAKLIDRGDTLRKQYERLKGSGGKAFEEVKKELIQVDKELQEVTGSIKDVEGALKQTNSKFDSLLGGLKGVGALIVAQFAADKIYQVAEGLVQVDKEVNKLNSDISKTFNTTEAAAQKTAIQIKAIADSFESLDSQDVFESARNGSKAFNESLEQSTSSLEKLLLNSSNAPEALDQFREYAPVLNEIFGSSEQVAASILQFERLGIPLDKGIDALKEFNLRITEQTTATSDAVKGLLGDTLGDELLRDIRLGEKGITEALNEISEKMGDATVDARIAQTVIADVFGEAGENAGGRKFVEQLKEANFNLEELTATSSIHIKQKEQEIRLNEALTTEIIGLNSELGIQGNSFKNLGLTVQVVAVKSFKALSMAINNRLIYPLKLGTEFILTFGKTFKTTIVSVTKDALNFGGNFKDAFLGAFTGDFSGFSTIIDEFGANTSEAFKNGIERVELGNFDVIKTLTDSILGENEDQSSVFDAILGGAQDGGDLGKKVVDSLSKVSEKAKAVREELANSQEIEPLGGLVDGVDNSIIALDSLQLKLKDTENVGITTADIIAGKYQSIALGAQDVAEKTGLVANTFGSLAQTAGEGTKAYETFTKAAETFAAAQQVAAQISIIAGIAQSLAGGPLGFLNALKIAASVASILATVKGAFENFEGGGSMQFLGNHQMSKGDRGVIGGNRHRNGGNKGFYNGNGFETEQGEGFAYVGGVPFVLSRKAMQLPDVRQLVEAADYTFPTFEQGGSFNVLAAQQNGGKNANIVVQNQGVSLSDVAYLMDKKIATIEVINVATETTAVASKVKKVKNEYGV